MLTVSLFFVALNFLDSVFESFPLCSFKVFHGFRLPTEETQLVVGHVLLLTVSECTSEDVLVFLLGEILVVVSVRMIELCWVVSVILPQTIGLEISTLSIFPSFELEI